MESLFELWLNQLRGKKEREVFLEWSEGLEEKMRGVIEPKVPEIYSDRKAYVDEVIQAARNMLRKTSDELHEIQMRLLRTMAHTTRDSKDILDVRAQLVQVDAASAILEVVHGQK